ncbi:hypothetical protein P691DRAFT_803449 [Macrolepiota fuliginosa MF-IS2]|uniref:DUF6533 domain-containing protein n=1 Tax=Macrolepiota fuliginosa MF-IS2 TaxID=1400762 RepID=A0A9P5XLQ9_9AGAR|nr:hypothetical protein P691DRAFT_803449 [Macrolepiota fuliginosa MF-IS2]
MTSTQTSSTLPHDILTTTIVYGPFHTPSEAAGAQAVNRSSIAALAFLVWDILITFDDEVNYIWPRSWNYTKCVYFFVRYVPVLVEMSILCIGTELTPLFHFTPHDCFIWQVYQAVAVTLIIMAVDTILILRVYALYNNSPVISNVLRCAFVAEIIGMIIGMVLAVPDIRYNDVCLVTHVPKTLGLWLVSLIFQTLLFSLTAYRFYGTVKAGWGDVPLMSLLMQDGTWAFFLLFLIYLGYALLVIIPHHSSSGVLYGWLVAAFSFSGYRIIIRLNCFGSTHPSVARTTNPPSQHTHHTSTDIQFTSNHRASEPESYELNTMHVSRPSQMTGQTSGLSAISELQLPP